MELLGEAITIYYISVHASTSKMTRLHDALQGHDKRREETRSLK